MRLTVFNMEFGESILIDDKNDQLLVDCGTISPKYFTDQKRRCILGQINTKSKISIMITHLHADHYNAIEPLFCNDVQPIKPVLNYVYIPWLRITKEKAPLVEEAIYLYMFYCQDSKSRTVEKILFLLVGQIQLFIRLGRMNGEVKVVTLKQGNTFLLGSCTMEVLWPNYDSENDEIDIDDFQFCHVKKIRQFFDYFQDKYMNETQKKKFEEIFHKIENNISLLYSKIEFTEESGYSVSDNNSYIHNMKQKQSQYIKELKNLKKEVYAMIPKRDHKDIANKKKEFKDNYRIDENARSIVFRDEKKPSQKKHKILMTGDITKKVIKNKLYDQYLKETTYKYVKAPHHGTKSHYTKYLPPGNRVIISNGLGQKNFGKICMEYVRLDSQKYCTNPRCENFCKNENEREETCFVGQCGIEEKSILNE